MSDKTSTLVALIFDDPYKAEEARAALHRMEARVYRSEYRTDAPSVRRAMCPG